MPDQMIQAGSMHTGQTLRIEIKWHVLNVNANRQTTASPSTAPRRSTRLAGKTLNSSVRASKKGEVLVKRKLGLCSDDGSSEQELASVFRGPLETSHYASLRDIFPAARALSDTELVAAAMQASQAVCAC
ncbi:unnamed protein product [Urochloa humidicola]